MSAVEIPAEIQNAYDDLLAAFGAFMEAFGNAASVGIDVQAVLTTQLRNVMPAEEWERLPPFLRMALG